MISKHFQQIRKPIGLLSSAAIALALTPAAGAAPVNPGLAAAYNGFGFALFARLRAAQPQTNVIISPTSVAIALAMTANGAGGGTRAAILRTLGVGDEALSTFNAENAALIASLHKPQGGVQFSLANALWLNAKLPVRPSFVTIGRNVFSATARNLPLGEPQATDEINAWVKRQTFGLIPAIVDSTDAADAAVLTNAMAMKATWQDPFEKSATSDARFSLESGTQTDVSMMRRTGTYGYAQDEAWQIARLPYTDRFAMYVFLPRTGTTLTAALAKATASSLDAAIGRLQASYIHLEMPRYTAAFESRLNAPLQSLGMATAFSDRADFSNLVAPPQRAAISQVNHRTFVRVDEEGTEAAAATSVAIRTLAMRVNPTPSASMIVNHPFLMAIRDDTTGQLLFVGAIYDPQR